MMPPNNIAKPAHTHDSEPVRHGKAELLAKPWGVGLFYIVCKWMVLSFIFIVLWVGLVQQAWAKPITYITQKQIASAYTLRIQLSPAVCALQPERRSLRQCRDGFFMTVIGLRPEIVRQNKKNNQYICSNAAASLSPLQEKVISRIMPDKAVQNLAWQRYGACTVLSSPQYFRMITKLSGNLRLPKELSTGNDYLVTKTQFIQKIINKNRGLSIKSMALVCNQANKNNSHVLTELQVCYDSAGKFSDCRQPAQLSCNEQFSIRGLP